MENAIEKVNDLYENSKELITKKEYDKASVCLRELIKIINDYYAGYQGKIFSFGHILETYYYSYFKKDESKLEYAQFNVTGYYRLYGFCLMHKEDYEGAVEAYQCALKWNPVDIDTMFQLGELYKKKGDLDNCKKITFEAYHYCCTRATMARFYRNLGFYYLESYKPETAAALYTYSNIYYSTKNAENELKFIEKATNKPLKEFTLPELQQILKDNNIPAGPDSDTIGITFRVGQLELKAGNTEAAKDCFIMVYDLTQDEEVKGILDSITTTEEGGKN